MKNSFKRFAVAALLALSVSHVSAGPSGIVEKLFVQNGAGAVPRTFASKAADTVSVRDFGAVGNGATDDTAAFTKAAAYAASVGADLTVPAPAVSYRIDSNPTIPTNLNVIASPHWFTGVGKLPMHAFVALSEGVDPRVFAVKSMRFTETEPGEKKRKWAVAGWVDNKNAPAAGYEGTATDAVGVDGRGRAAAANARVWGVVGLGQLDAGVSGVAQAYAAEFDINNNFAHSLQDGSPTAKGIVLASGGTYRPEVGHFVIATKTPTNGGGDNRFMYGLRFYQDCCSTANVHIDDGNGGDAVRIPNTSKGIHWATNSNLTNFYMRVNKNNNHLELTVDQNQAFDIYNSANQKVLIVTESSIEPQKPVGLHESTYGTLPTSVNASIADVITFGASGTVTGGITGGVSGQVLTLVNASTATVTISRNANMRTPGGGPVYLYTLQALQFIYTGGTWFQIGPTNNG